MKMNLAQYFTTENSRKCVTFKDDAPKWLLNAVRDAHHGALPNDWIWEMCRAACEAIDSGELSLENETDDMHAFADARASIYTHDQIRWLADMYGCSLYADAEEAAKDMGREIGTIPEQIAVVQYCAIALIGEAIVSAARHGLAK